MLTINIYYITTSDKLVAYCMAQLIFTKLRTTRCVRGCRQRKGLPGPRLKAGEDIPSRLTQSRRNFVNLSFSYGITGCVFVFHFLAIFCVQRTTRGTTGLLLGLLPNCILGGTLKLFIQAKWYKN